MDIIGILTLIAFVGMGIYKIYNGFDFSIPSEGAGDSLKNNSLREITISIVTGLEEEFKHYQNINSDEYGSAIISYATRWAEMMEEKMRGGLKLSDIADSTSHEADTEGITGFMYGAAVSTLAKFWEHGEELRQWHNLKYQRKDEGEKANNKKGAVLNPALLTIEDE